MGRKSKQAGSGHLPLTNYERNLYGKPYGTTTQRLAGVSQCTFGHCAFSLHPAKKDPVATPSGFIYERAAMIEYLWAKTQECKQAQLDYERHLQERQHDLDRQEQDRKRAAIEQFENNQKVVVRKKQKIEDNPLKRTSFWLADAQPELQSNNGKGKGASDDKTLPPSPPSSRPLSPHSQQPLRRKDLIPLQLEFNTDHQVVCAISGKVITTQQAVALVSRKTSEAQPAPVVLDQVFQSLGDTKRCPITGEKIKQVLSLQKGGSSFAAAGGTVEAATYRPSMT